MVLLLFICYKIHLDRSKHELGPFAHICRHVDERGMSELNNSALRTV